MRLIQGILRYSFSSGIGPFAVPAGMVAKRYPLYVYIIWRSQCGRSEESEVEGIWQISPHFMVTLINVIENKTIIPK